MPAACICPPGALLLLPTSTTLDVITPPPPALPCSHLPALCSSSRIMWTLVSLWVERRFSMSNPTSQLALIPGLAQRGAATACTVLKSKVWANVSAFEVEKGRQDSASWWGWAAGAKFSWALLCVLAALALLKGAARNRPGQGLPRLQLCRITEVPVVVWTVQDNPVKLDFHSNNKPPS